MSLNRLACYTPLSRLAYRTSIRMAFTIVGNSGRVYVQGEVLQRHREDHKLSVFKAEYVSNSMPFSWSSHLTHRPRSGNESFVFKRVPRPFYDLSIRLAAKFAGSRRLRMHIDCNEEDSILIYPYFRSNLLALIQEDPDFPPAERKQILRRIGEGIQELHGKNWIHIGTLSTNQKLLPFNTFKLMDLSW
jgi:serine/threonine protein kinase